MAELFYFLKLFHNLYMRKYNLYLVLTSTYRRDLDPVLIAEQAIDGGIDVLQMREKSLSKQDLVNLGKKYRELCSKRKVAFIVNDDPYLAMQVDADGVHMGQEDIQKMGIEKLRDIMKDKIIGISTHNVNQFQLADNWDIDYIAYGPLFETKTKDYFIGLDDVKIVLQGAKKEVVFIGGINLGNVDQVLDLGAGNIAVIRDIVCADDIISHTKKLKEKLTLQNR